MFSLEHTRTVVERAKGNRTGKSNVPRTWSPGPGVPWSAVGDVVTRTLSTSVTLSLLDDPPRRKSTQEDGLAHPLEKLEGQVGVSESAVQFPNGKLS